MTPKVPAKNIDLINDSKNYLIALSFEVNRSPRYRSVVALSQGATKYQEEPLEGGGLIHLAVFDDSPSQVSRAIAILNHVWKWDSIQLFTKGRLVDVEKALKVLECYSEAQHSDDWQAHCFTVIDDPAFAEEAAIQFFLDLKRQALERVEPKYVELIPEKINVQRYVFPCQLLYSKRVVSTDHPASVVNQIQAAGVKAACDICPKFNPGNYKKTGKPVSISLFDDR